MMEENFRIQLQRFGRSVRQLRISQGLSQEAFSDACGLDRTYIGGVERGERNISFVNIQKISHALDVPASTLFKEVEKDIR